MMRRHGSVILARVRAARPGPPGASAAATVAAPPVGRHAVAATAPQAATEPLILAEARIRHRDALAALRTAEGALAESRRRGDAWGTQRAVWALEAAGRAYTAADNWLVSVLLGRVG